MGQGTSNWWSQDVEGRFNWRTLGAAQLSTLQAVQTRSSKRRADAASSLAHASLVEDSASKPPTQVPFDKISKIEEISKREETKGFTLEEDKRENITGGAVNKMNPRQSFAPSDSECRKPSAGSLLSKRSNFRNNQYQSEEVAPSTDSTTESSGLSQSTSENSLISSRSVDTKLHRVFGTSNTYKTRLQQQYGDQLKKQDPPSILRASRESLASTDRRPSLCSSVISEEKPGKRKKKDARRAEIVAAVTRRLYSNSVKKATDDKGDTSVEVVQESNEKEPDELKLCSNARAKLQEITRRAMNAHRRSKTKEDAQNQTDIERPHTLRVKDKCINTDMNISLNRAEGRTDEVNYNFGDNSRVWSQQPSICVIHSGNEGNTRITLTRLCCAETLCDRHESYRSIQSCMMCSQQGVWNKFPPPKTEEYFSDDSLESNQEFNLCELRTNHSAKGKTEKTCIKQLIKFTSGCRFNSGTKECVFAVNPKYNVRGQATEETQPLSVTVSRLQGIHNNLHQLMKSTSNEKQNSNLSHWSSPAGYKAAPSETNSCDEISRINSGADSFVGRFTNESCKERLFLPIDISSSSQSRDKNLKNLNIRQRQSRSTDTSEDRFFTNRPSEIRIEQPSPYIHNPLTEYNHRRLTKVDYSSDEINSMCANDNPRDWQLGGVRCAQEMRSMLECFNNQSRNGVRSNQNISPTKSVVTQTIAEGQDDSIISPGKGTATHETVASSVPNYSLPEIPNRDSFTNCSRTEITNMQNRVCKLKKSEIFFTLDFDHMFLKDCDIPIPLYTVSRIKKLFFQDSFHDVTTKTTLSISPNLLERNTNQQNFGKHSLLPVMRCPSSDTDHEGMHSIQVLVEFHTHFKSKQIDSQGEIYLNGKDKAPISNSSINIGVAQDSHAMSNEPSARELFKQGELLNKNQHYQSFRVDTHSPPPFTYCYNEDPNGGIELDKTNKHDLDDHAHTHNHHGSSEDPSGHIFEGKYKGPETGPNYTLGGCKNDLEAMLFLESMKEQYNHYCDIGRTDDRPNAIPQIMDTNNVLFLPLGSNATGSKNEQEHTEQNTHDAKQDRTSPNLVGKSQLNKYDIFKCKHNSTLEELNVSSTSNYTPRPRSENSKKIVADLNNGLTCKQSANTKLWGDRYLNADDAIEISNVFKDNNIDKILPIESKRVFETIRASDSTPKCFALNTAREGHFEDERRVHDFNIPQNSPQNTTFEENQEILYAPNPKITDVMMGKRFDANQSKRLYNSEPARQTHSQTSTERNILAKPNTDIFNRTPDYKNEDIFKMPINPRKGTNESMDFPDDAPCLPRTTLGLDNKDVDGLWNDNGHHWKDMKGLILGRRLELFSHNSLDEGLVGGQPFDKVSNKIKKSVSWTDIKGLGALHTEIFVQPPSMEKKYTGTSKLETSRNNRYPHCTCTINYPQESDPNQRVACRNEELPLLAQPGRRTIQDNFHTGTTSQLYYPIESGKEMSKMNEGSLVSPTELFRLSDLLQEAIILVNTLNCESDNSRLAHKVSALSGNICQNTANTAEQSTLSTRCIKVQASKLKDCLLSRNSLRSHKNRRKEKYKKALRTKISRLVLANKSWKDSYEYSTGTCSNYRGIQEGSKYIKNSSNPHNGDVTKYTNKNTGIKKSISYVYLQSVGCQTKSVEDKMTSTVTNKNCHTETFTWQENKDKITTETHVKSKLNYFENDIIEAKETNDKSIQTNMNIPLIIDDGQKSSTLIDTIPSFLKLQTTTTIKDPAIYNKSNKYEIHTKDYDSVYLSNLDDSVSPCQCDKIKTGCHTSSTKNYKIPLLNLNHPSNESEYKKSVEGISFDIHCGDDTLQITTNNSSTSTQLKKKTKSPQHVRQYPNLKDSHIASPRLSHHTNLRNIPDTTPSAATHADRACARNFVMTRAQSVPQFSHSKYSFCVCALCLVNGPRISPRAYLQDLLQVRKRFVKESFEL